MKKGWLFIAQYLSIISIILMLLFPKLMLKGLKKIWESITGIGNNLPLKFDRNFIEVTIQLFLIILSLTFCFIGYELLLKKKRKLKKIRRHRKFTKEGNIHQ